LAILLVVDEAQNINTTQVLHRPATARAPDTFCYAILALAQLGKVHIRITL
jgi:hypothetical protein